MLPHLLTMTTSSLPRDAGSRFSPLVLADCLITLAKQADQAGYRSSADRLIGLAYAVMDDEGPRATAAAA